MGTAGLLSAAAMKNDINIWPLLSLAMIAVNAVFFYRFEKQRTAVVEKSVLIAVLSAISAVGRGMFAAIPSVQPSSFIIIIAGITLGGDIGFMTGALTALLSGLFLGIGPWTPWQMISWGLMGGLAGLLRKPLVRYKWMRVVYGVAWGLLFGWIMNLWMLMTVDSVETGLAYIISIYAASFLFDGMHAAANAILIMLGGDAIIKALTRIAAKYGLTKA